MQRAMLALLIVVAGFGLGTMYGRVIAPVEYVDTDPSSLRIDFRSDYVLMVAERYAADHDVDAALRRLAVLGPSTPDLLTAEAIQFAVSAGYSPEDLALLHELLRGVQEKTLLAPAAGTAP